MSRSLSVSGGDMTTPKQGQPIPEENPNFERAAEGATTDVQHFSGSGGNAASPQN